MAEEKIELRMDMDPEERLAKEIELTNNESAKRVGQFLLEQFKKDEVLRECYKDRKVVLNHLWKYIVEQARKVAGDQDSCAIDDETVYGWAIHFVQDGEIKDPDTEKLVVTCTVKKEKAKLKVAAKKEKKKREESGQLSLFDDWDWGDGNA